jgi:hypothetical protein
MTGCPATTSTTRSQSACQSLVERAEFVGEAAACDGLGYDGQSHFRADEHQVGFVSCDGVEEVVDVGLNGSAGPRVRAVHRRGEPAADIVDQCRQRIVGPQLLCSIGGFGGRPMIRPARAVGG